MRLREPIGPARAREGIAGALEVRPMGLADLEDVMELERLAFKHPWSTELFRRELLHDWSTILLAAGKKPSFPKVYGFVIFWLVHDEIHILNLASHPKLRRQGIARRLIAEAIERGRARGATLTTLEVRRSNFPALSLYRALGFRQVGVRPNYYVDEGEDAVVMVLDM
jgi:ribosomal-protein-alanine N-acetyltransferase